MLSRHHMFWPCGLGSNRVVTGRDIPDSRGGGYRGCTTPCRKWRFPTKKRTNGYHIPAWICSRPRRDANVQVLGNSKPGNPRLWYDSSNIGRELPLLGCGANSKCSRTRTQILLQSCDQIFPPRGKMKISKHAVEDFDPMHCRPRIPSLPHITPGHVRGV